MADEELELDLDNNEEINREKDRNKKLADKVKSTSEERDAQTKAREEAEARATASQKDVEFYKNFNTLSSKYSGANEYQDKIREKVMAGYDMEDAAISILAKEGKYTPAVPVVERESAAGGSASTAIRGGDGKTPQEMTQAERKSALEEAFAKGEISL